MSFFDDEDDDPPPNPRQASSRPRPAPRRRPTGAGEHQQQVQTRRIVAVVSLVVIIVVIALLVHGCSVSANKSSLETYSSSVYTLIGNSDANGKKLFSDLASSSSETDRQAELYTLHTTAENELRQAERLSVPGAMSRAQTYLVLTFQERADGIKLITTNLQAALGSNNGTDGVRRIAQGMAYLYSSDVVYKGYAARAISGALHGSSLTVSSSTINPGQIMTDLGWVQQKFIATKIGAKLPSKEVNAPPVPGGLYGHTLNSVSVGSTELIPGQTNTVAASAAPTFVLSVTNGGEYNELDVTCKVSVEGQNDHATATIAETTPGETTTCSVQLPKPPTAGTWKVVAQVEEVPGEKNLANNKLIIPVDFTG
jgi:hypothetical protein